MIKIDGHKNIFYIEDRWISDDVKLVTKKEIAKAQLNKVGRAFAVYVQVSPLVNGKQKHKRKKFKFDGTVTFTVAMKSLRDTADEMKAELLGEGAIKNNPRNASVNSIWDEFYDYKVGTSNKPWRYRTAKGLGHFYNKWIRNDLGLMKVGDVVESDVDALIEEVLSERSISTAKGVYNTLQPMFKWYFRREGIREMNPAMGYEFGAMKNARVNNLSIDEVKELYELMSEHPIVDIRNAFLLILQGRRSNEVLSLKSSDVVDGYYTVRAENNKAKIDMMYKLPDSIELGDDAGEYAIKSLKFAGQPMSDQSLRRAFKDCLNDTQDGFHMHDLRHAIGEILRDNEVPLEFRALVLGHSDGAIITNRYSKRATKKVADTSFKVWSYFTECLYDAEIPKWDSWNSMQ